MSDFLLDDVLLNDEDEDLDYDLDPKEENALLQEDSDVHDQDFEEEEDVLELNEDFEQIDVPEGTEEKTPGKMSNEKNIKSLADEKKNNQNAKHHKNIKPRIIKGVRRMINRNKGGNFNNGRPMRRSKTVLINPRFKGPVHVNSNQFSWEAPPCNSFERNVQPWATGNHGHHQMPPPMNTFTPPNFVPNQGGFIPQFNTNFNQPPMQPPIPPLMPPQQIILNQPIPNQLLLNQPVQMNPCPNQFQFHPPPQLHNIPQMQEQPKLPVHQRLGMPSSNQPQTPPNIFPTMNNSSQFNGYQQNQPNFNQNQRNFNRPNYSQRFYGNHRKNVGNFKNNNKVVPIRKNNFNEENEKKSSISEKSDVKQNVIEENSKPQNDDEDEETREYRMKIEEQKRKREEILKRKEESRRKNMANEFPEQPPQQVKPIRNVTRNFQQKRFNNFQHKPQNFQHSQNKLHKPQNYTNNIVITANDHNNQKFRADFGQTERIVSTGDFVPPIVKQVQQQQDEEVSSFLRSRSVIAQDDLTQTNIVIVKNLALATNEPKIMKLCKEVGSVQKLQLEKDEHQATIHFNTVASAHAFYNKFRRRIIDLSMVQVDLVPSESSS